MKSAIFREIATLESWKTLIGIMEFCHALTRGSKPYDTMMLRNLKSISKVLTKTRKNLQQNSSLAFRNIFQETIVVAHFCGQPQKFFFAQQRVFVKLEIAGKRQNCNNSTYKFGQWPFVNFHNKSDLTNVLQLLQDSSKNDKPRFQADLNI